MKKRISSIALILSMLIGLFTFGASGNAAEPKLPFTDVKESDWFYDVVSYNYENSLMKGTSDVLFEPTTTMSRAMFITAVGRIDGAVETESDAFGDVVKNTWYSGYVGWANENGIVEGFEDGSFRPDKEITREEAAKAIIKYVEYLGIVASRDREAPKSFADKESISTWAYKFVESLRVTGIIEGDENGNFNPSKSLNRAEAAAVFARLNTMKNDLALDDPITADYLVDGEEFNLLGAYQMYYSGTALTTSYNASKVDDDGAAPILTKNDDGRKFTHFYSAPANIAAKGNYFALDLKQLCVNVTEYPVLRVGYKVTGGTFDFAVNAVAKATPTTIDFEPTTANEAALDGYSYSIIDVSSANISNDDNDEIKFTFMTGSDEADIELAYVAFFKTASEAEAFDVSKYVEDFKNYEGYDIKYEKIDKDSDLIKGYMKDMDDKIDEIMAAEDLDPSVIEGTCYYISSVNGDDSNDGKSPEKPWKSISKLYTKKLGQEITILKPGDGVFFERGSVFYAAMPTNGAGDFVMGLASGVTYAAYGKGDKPVMTTAVEFPDGSKTGKWNATDVPNVYELDYTFEVPEGSKKTYHDVSNISFDGGKAWGIKVLMTNDEDPIGHGTIACGMVTNGIDYYYEGGEIFKGKESLTKNLEYWLDYDAKKLYLCSTVGNPGEIFNDIKITKNGNGVYAGGENTFVDNIAFKHIGTLGIDASDSINFTVQNCEFGWIGGSEMGSRLGNAIQNWASCDGFYAFDNYIYQIYDTGITTQGNSGVMKNVEWSGNVIEYCNMAIEIFNNGDEDVEHVLANIKVANNYERFAGYGFGHQRPIGNKTGTFYLGAKHNNADCTNLVIENNICLYATFFAGTDSQLARGEKARGTIFRNNVYLMSADRAYSRRTFNSPYEFYDYSGGSYNKTLLPYTEQYIQYMANMGIERGSTFYFYDGYAFPFEEFGVYYDDYENVK